MWGVVWGVGVGMLIGGSSSRRGVMYRGRLSEMAPSLSLVVIESWKSL